MCSPSRFLMMSHVFILSTLVVLTAVCCAGDKIVTTNVNDTVTYSLEDNTTFADKSNTERAENSNTPSADKSMISAEKTTTESDVKSNTKASCNHKSGTDHNPHDQNLTKDDRKSKQITSDTTLTSTEPKTSKPQPETTPEPQELSGTDPEFTFETFVTIVVTLAIVVSNCLILIVAAWTDAFNNFNKIFIYSLTAADLFIGLFITPYSIFLSVYRTWVFSSENFCSVEAYLLCILLNGKLYSLTWLNVDHYVAVRKPERHNVMMSPVRSFCWIIFSWVIGVSFCGPPIFTNKTLLFSTATYICQVDLGEQMFYLLTAMMLLFLPSAIAFAITFGYQFTPSFHKRISFYEKVFVELSSRPHNYKITCVQGGVFFLMWTPFVLITLSKAGGFEIHRTLEFTACWLGLSAGFTPFISMLAMSQSFRTELFEIMPVMWCNKPRPPPPVQVKVIKVNDEKRRRRSSSQSRGGEARQTKKR